MDEYSFHPVTSPTSSKQLKVVVTCIYFFSFHNLKDLSTKEHLFSRKVVNPPLSNVIAAKSKGVMLWLVFGALRPALGLVPCLASEEDKGRVSFCPWL